MASTAMRYETCRICQRGMPVSRAGKMRDHVRKYYTEGMEVTVQCRGAWQLYPAMWDEDDAASPS
jgi:hypothetical protein